VDLTEESWPVFLLFDPPVPILRDADFVGASGLRQFKSSVRRGKLIPIISSFWSASAYHDAGIRPVLLPSWTWTRSRAEVEERGAVLDALGVPSSAYHFISPVGDALAALLDAFCRLGKLGLKATLTLHARDADETAAAVCGVKELARRSECDRRRVRNWAREGVITVAHEVGESAVSQLYGAHDCCIVLDRGARFFPEAWASQRASLWIIAVDGSPVSDQGHDDQVLKIPALPAAGCPGVLHLEESMLHASKQPGLPAVGQRSVPGLSRVGPLEIARLINHEKQWEDGMRETLAGRWPGPI
jgi:hypothetical protein